MKDFLDEIVDASPEMKRLVTEEGFILDAIEEIYAAMEKAGVSKTDLARELGCSLANISQKLRGTSNLTLRTVAAIAHAMNLKPTLRLEAPEAVNGWGKVYINEVINVPGVVVPCNDAQYEFDENMTNHFDQLLA